MPTESLYPPIDIPNTDVWGLMFERKNKGYEDDHVIYTDTTTHRTYSFAQVKSLAIAFGTGLKSVWEWQRHDVLGLYTPNHIDVAPIIWGTHWAGGIVTPANPAYTVDELTFQLKNAGAKALATQKHCLDVARKACRNAGIPEDRIILLGDERDETVRYKHWSAIRNLAGTSRYRRTKAKNPADDLAFIVYSSGTTGLPKGVMLTHRNIVANVLQQDAVDEDNISSKDKVLAFLPFFHIYGLNCLLHAAFFKGFNLCVMPRFEIEAFCKIVSSQKITFAFLVPPVVLLLAKHPIVSKYDLSSLRMTNSGAAPLTKEVVDAFWNRLHIPVKQGYGLSETSPTTHTQRWEEWYTTLGSVGRMMPNMTAKYVGADEREVAAGQPGELWLKGPNIFKGYLANAAGTADALTADGYFRTGDVGYQDGGGSFYITDRLKELIKYKGFQVPPAELEGLLVGNARVDDAAVVGVYDPDQATEVPRAYVVLKPDGAAADGGGGGAETEQTAEEIAAWIAERVAPHKRLRGGVRFVKEIPKSGTGKILRRVLREQAKREGAGKVKAKL